MRGDVDMIFTLQIKDQSVIIRWTS